MDVKTIREGGNNGVQVRLTGPIAYGTLTLKRGMTASFDLWDWFSARTDDPSVRARRGGRAARPGRHAPSARASCCTGCLPVKLKAPPLNAKDGMVAIEELQLAYESLELQKPEGGCSCPTSPRPSCASSTPNFENEIKPDTLDARCSSTPTR